MEGEGLRTATGSATSASAQVSAADGRNRNTPVSGDKDTKVLGIPAETLPEDRAGNAASAPAVASTDASATAAATAAALEEEVTTTPQRNHRDTSSTDRSGGGGGHGSGRNRGGGGGRWARDVNVAWLSQQTKGYSGADLSSLVRNAAMVALREEGESAAEGAVRLGSTSAAGGSVGRSGLLVLARRHFEAALASTEPSSGPEAVAKHERWARQWHVAS